MSAENNTQATKEEFKFPDYVTLKTKNDHEFIVQGRLLRHIGMYRKLFNKEIAEMMAQGWSEVNKATHTTVDTPEYDNTHIALLVDYLHFRDHWIPNEKQENVPEYPITDKIDTYNDPNTDKKDYIEKILILTNEFDC